MSPEAKDLFSRAILQSGTAYNPWAMQENPLTYAKVVASELNCPTDTSAAIRECLIGKTDDELFDAYIKVTSGSSLTLMYFVPVVEGGSTTEPFLPDTPSNLVKTKRYNKVPVITGVTSNEAGTFGAPTKVDKQFLDSGFTSFLQNMTGISGDHFYMAAAAVRQEYFTGVDFNNQQQLDTAMQEIISDGMFTAGNDMLVRKLVKDGATVYMYVLYYSDKNPFLHYKGCEHLGANHGDDITYLFDVMFVNGGKLSEGDAALVSNRMLTMWTNFAKTGNPTPTVTNEIPIKWEPVKSKDDINYLHIDKELSVASNFRVDKARFWNKYIPKVASGEGLRRKDEL
jgi:carboxylesterase type B